MGGGTLLAAEWEHRATKDINLKLEPGTKEDRLEPELNDTGPASSNAAMAMAAACFRAKRAGQPHPAGERSARVLAGYRRASADRGRGRATPFSAADLAAVLAARDRPRRHGCGVEPDQAAATRGRLDAVMPGCYSWPDCGGRTSPPCGGRT